MIPPQKDANGRVPNGPHPLAPRRPFGANDGMVSTERLCFVGARRPSGRPNRGPDRRGCRPGGRCTARRPLSTCRSARAKPARDVSPGAYELATASSARGGARRLIRTGLDPSLALHGRAAGDGARCPQGSCCTSSVIDGQPPPLQAALRRPHFGVGPTAHPHRHCGAHGDAVSGCFRRFAGVSAALGALAGSGRGRPRQSAPERASGEALPGRTLRALRCSER